MFIQTEATPNPSTLKFLPGQDVMGPKGTADFQTADSAAQSPLAQRLFALEGVEGVFLGYDFVTVTKADDQSWPFLKPLVLSSIMEHYTEEQPIYLGEKAGEGDVNEDALSQQIRELIDTRVRPAVAQDGGDIVFRHFSDGIVYLNMQGACAGCPSSTATLRNGIENMLKYYVPEVVAVQAVE